MFPLNIAGISNDAGLINFLKQGKGMKKQILLIDDDRDELDLFVQALEEIPGSFYCSYAEAAEQAMRLLDQFQPDYIFIDYNLPRVNGVELLADIKKDKRLNDIPAFIYSTHVSPDMLNQALKAGAMGCIQKPKSIRMMSDVLRNVLVSSRL
jgi:DNA-binding NtrC family response regulator